MLGAAACAATDLPACGARDQVPAILAPELADERALAELVDWLGLPHFETGRYRVQSSEDRLGGEPVPNPLWADGNRDMNNFICASRDAEPPPGTEPFRLDRPSCDEPWARGYVLARFEGAGRLGRLWLTADSLRRGPADREVLRIYVDDEPSPVVQVALSRALDGTAGEVFARPFGAGSSRRMAWHYPVVFGSRLIVTLDRLHPRDLYFYQAAAVLDEPAVPRRRAPAKLAARDRARALLADDRPRPAPASVRTEHLSLPARGSSRLGMLGPATITNLTVRVPERDVDRLADITLAVRWDGDDRAAIDLPLASLFAATLAPVEVPSLALASRWEGTELGLTLRLPMPFALSADFVVTNRSPRPTELTIELTTEESLPTEPWGWLHVQSAETLHTTSPTHPLASALGPGRLAGVCIAMQGRGVVRAGMRGHPMNFLEGDEVAVVDGTRALAGTGTEDYFDGAFYFEDAPSASPFAQAWDVDDGQDRGRGRASACRWHLLGDEIDFQEALEQSLEIGPADPAVLDRLSSVAFLYGRP